MPEDEQGVLLASAIETSYFAYIYTIHSSKQETTLCCGSKQYKSDIIKVGYSGVSLKSSDYYLLVRPEPEPVALRATGQVSTLTELE